MTIFYFSQELAKLTHSDKEIRAPEKHDSSVEFRFRGDETPFEVADFAQIGIKLATADNKVSLIE